jgi:hypothetical protein
MGDGDWQDSPVFNNLSSGTEYSFTVRYAETESYAASPASEAVTFSTKKAEQTAPDAPELESRTENSITLKAIPDNANGVKAQYRMGDGDWQDSPVFNNLSSGTEYSFTVRYAETKSYAASPASEAVTFSTKNVFVDVPSDAYYAEAVEWAILNNATEGKDDTHFCPDDTCTRAEAVTFLWRAAGKPKPESTTLKFKDVPKDAYYYDAVLWAVDKGITKGTTKDTFSPDETCNRAQAVTLLWRYQGSLKVTGENPFDDVSENRFYSDAVLWAAQAEVTKGTTKNTFSPNRDCSRAQIVTFLWRSIAK